MQHGDKLAIGGGIFLGVGLGAFVDGILFHQLLQWHQMISSVLPPLTLVTAKVNMLWDGVFHVFAWVMTVAGVFTLARSADAPREVALMRSLPASLAIGWGAFNVVEGLIDHQLLGVHHVHPGAYQEAWDAGFVAFGAALVFVGVVGLERRAAPALRPATA